MRFGVLMAVMVVALTYVRFAVSCLARDIRAMGQVPERFWRARL